MIRGQSVAIEPLELRIAKGELLVALGRNGAGKTSLLLGAMGLLPHGGRLFLQNEDVSGLAPDRRARLGIRLVRDQRDAFFGLSVRENLAAGAILRKDCEVRDDLDRVLGLFPELKTRLANAASTLSGGEQRKLSIARALMGRPNLLLLDEPSGGLSPRSFKELLPAIHRVASGGTSVLLAEQGMEGLDAIADRVAVFSQGRLAGLFPGRAAFDRKRIEAAYWGEA